MVSTKRDDILKAALELFAERGFHGTSVPELAKVADVGPGTIYRHFESKEAIVNSLYQHWKAVLMQELFFGLPEGLTWRARVREIWVRMFAFHAANPGVIDFLDLHHHSDYLDETSKMVEAQSAAAFLGLVMQAQAEEALCDLPAPAIAAMVYSAFLGLIRAASEGFIALDDALIAATEAQVWAMIRR